MRNNPLLTESTLPLHYPRFDLIKDADYAPAFERGMAEQLQEIDAIVNNPDKPTFENTIIALEQTGNLFARVRAIFFNLSGANTNPQMQKLERELSPKLAAHKNAILLDAKLFARIEELYNNRETLALDAQAQHLLWRYYQDFLRAGVKLGAADKVKLKALNEEIATLQTDFSQKVLKEVSDSAVYFDKKEQLAGLSEEEINAAAEQAKTDGHPGKFEKRLQNTTGQVLSKLTNRSTRQKIMNASLTRNNHGANDTRNNVVKLAKKRAERAQLLGYPTFAAYKLADQTAGSVHVVNKMLGQLAPLAVAKARSEAAEMQAIIDEEKGGFQLAAEDWSYYAEKVRKKHYDFDETQLMPYYELNHVLLDGVFFAANKLYGITLKERHDLPVYEPTVRVFDVFDKNGSQLAILMADMYARPNKKGGDGKQNTISRTSCAVHCQ